MQSIQGASRHLAVAMVPTGPWPITSFLAGSVLGTKGVSLWSSARECQEAAPWIGQRPAACSPHFTRSSRRGEAALRSSYFHGHLLELPPAGILPVPHLLPQALPAHLLRTWIQAEGGRCVSLRTRGLGSRLSLLREMCVCCTYSHLHDHVVPMFQT